MGDPRVVFVGCALHSENLLRARGIRIRVDAVYCTLSMYGLLHAISSSATALGALMTCASSSAHLRSRARREKATHDHMVKRK